MAIAVISKGASSSTSNTSAYTATITAPTTNRPQLAFIANSKASTADAPSSVVSTGLTWTKIADVSFGTIATALRRLTVWRAAGTSSATSVTINFPANQTGCAWSFVEITGGDETGVGGANLIADSAVLNQDGGTGLPLNLGGIVFTGDAVIAAFGLDTVNAVTAQEGFTQITTQTWSSPAGRIATQYHLTYDTTPTASWTASNSGGIALELKLAANAFKSNPKPGELVSLTDTLADIKVISAPINITSPAESVALSDAASAQRYETLWLGTMNLLDMPQQADTASLTDTLTNMTVSVAADALAIPVGDSVTLSESPTVKGLLLTIATADLATVTDSPPVVLLSSLSALTINAPDSVTLTDAATQNLLILPQASDSLTLSEGRTVQAVAMPQVADSVTLTDTPTVGLEANPQGSDSVTLTDIVTLKGLILVIPATDLLTLGDTGQAIRVGTIPLENFDDNTQNTALWEVASTSETTDARVLISETGHQLQITPFPNAGVSTLAYNGYRSVSSYNLTDLGIFVEVPQVAGVGTTTDTILSIAIDANNSYSIAYEGTTLYFQDRVSGLSNSATVAYNASTHRWWRIRHVSAGNTIRFDTSPNGTVWTEQRNIGAALSVTGMKIGIEAGTYTNVGSPGVAIFDNFNTSTLTIFPADQVTLTESRVISGLPIPVSVADAVTTTDIAVVGGTRIIQQADSVTLGDSAEAELVAPLADTVTVTDNALVQLWYSTWGGTVNLLDLPHSADSVTLTDTRTVTLSAAGTLTPQGADSVTLSDGAPVTGLTLVLPAADSLTLSDQAAIKGLIPAPTVNDTLTVTDQATITGLTLPMSLADSVALTDTVTPRGLIPSITAADSVTLTDTPALTGLTLILGTPADVVTLTENRTVIAALPGIWQIPASDSVTLTDTPFVSGLTLKPSTADSVTLTETRTVSLWLTPRVADSVTLTDSVSVKGLIPRITAAESVTLSDAASWQLSKILITRGDQVTLTDSATRNFVDQFVSQPLIVFTVPARDFTVTATIGITAFTVPARDFTVDAVADPLVFTVAARDFTVEAVIGVTAFVVPARDFTVEASAA